MAEFQIREQLLSQVYLIDCPNYFDNRGSFTKILNTDDFLSLGLDFTPRETFVTTSSANVLRGMHYQAGLAAHDKVVSCLRGKVLDVVVCIDPASSEFNQPISINLNDSDPFALYIGRNYAHGFLSLEDMTCMHYQTSTVHCPELDFGVHWSSIDFNWPTKSPIISSRDSFHRNIQDLL